MAMLIISYLLHKSELEVSINKNKKHIFCSTINKVSIFANKGLDTGICFPSQNANRLIYFFQNYLTNKQKTSCLYLQLI